ncbi:Kv channel-interacting protein 2-like [Diabrotica virgifera virgifera]|uniref:EF-hand domain-containing protein n=2 Tax=Diabrotica virgifera virgifera TaxID=50390 RepID=A0ABM5L9C2_DIAVI|nr:Kv channel-interacting protein 2-like [Diabrotica virgifera virgifera]
MFKLELDSKSSTTDHAEIVEKIAETFQLTSSKSIYDKDFLTYKEQKESIPINIYFVHIQFIYLLSVYILQLHLQDFLNILSKVSRGTVNEKIQWVFNLYDLNGDGLISKNEMVDVVTSIYEMLGRATQPAVEDSSAKEHVEKIFNMIDTNKDGVITIDELIQWCSRDEHFLRSLETLDTVL